MKVKMYSVYDVKAKVHQYPFQSHNNFTAMRTFQATIQKADTMLAAYPEDFNLYLLGEFDDNSGIIVPMEKPEYVCPALDFVKVQEKGLENHDGRKKPKT